MKSTSGPVLVVGGCGFLGHHVVTQLLNSDHHVSILDIDTTRNRFPGPSTTYYDGDISSFSDLLVILRSIKPHVIIHTASVVEAAGHPALFHKVNVEGTRNLLECARQIGSVKAFVYTSSASVVHDSVSDLYNADERLPVLRMPQQKDLYSHTKGVAEDLVLAANRQHGILTVSLRPAGIFGKGDVQTIPSMVQAYETGKTRFQLGNNANFFDFTNVRNVAHAHLLAMQKLMDIDGLSVPPSVQERVDGEAFFITNGQPYLFWDFARAIWAAAGDKTDPKSVWVIPKNVALPLATVVEWIFWILFWGRKEPSLTRRKIKFSTMNRTYCIDKAEKRLGYKPLVNMEDSIIRSVQ
ncbi:erg26, C-3 sterol dehydrogenase [Peltigera leucophlebia]|nr:erg26, C-3 sterol dehydrogenase [Peltigera leucophlebia]